MGLGLVSTECLLPLSLMIAAECQQPLTADRRPRRRQQNARQRARGCQQQRRRRRRLRAARLREGTAPCRYLVEVGVRVRVRGRVRVRLGLESGLGRRAATCAAYDACAACAARNSASASE